MNISLSKKSKASGSLGFGLNSRGSSSTKKKKKKSNVFDDGSDDDDDAGQGGDGVDDTDRSGLSGREQVNRQIAAEQAALRKRAQAAAAAIEDPSVYDYDGAYDSFKQEEEDAKEAKKAQDADKKSRYIGDLLKAAKKREKERDAIYERKVAREQAEEDAQAEYVGKEKFITKAYKRKLEERKKWEAEEEEQRLEEEKNDVTKQTDGKAFGNFYANFNRNVSMGGKKRHDDDNAEKKRDGVDKNDDGGDSHKKDQSELLKEELGLGGGGGMGFLDGFERPDADEEEAGGESRQSSASTAGAGATTTMALMNNNGAVKPANNDNRVPKLSIREQREKKVAEARVRYLARKQRQQLLSGHLQ